MRYACILCNIPGSQILLTSVQKLENSVSLRHLPKGKARVPARSVGFRCTHPAALGWSHGTSRCTCHLSGSQSVGILSFLGWVVRRDHALKAHRHGFRCQLCNLPHDVTLCKFLNTCGPQFPHPQNGNICFLKLFRGLLKVDIKCSLFRRFCCHPHFTQGNTRLKEMA